MVSIWIASEDKEKILKVVEAYEEGDPLFEGHSIDELYIDPHSGAFQGFIDIGLIGVSVDIPFEEWFREFLRLKSFESLEGFLRTHHKEVKEAIAKVGNINVLIRSSDKTGEET